MPITYISNLLLISLLDKLSPYKAFTRLFPQLKHLKVLGSTVYIFIYKEKKKSKSVKSEPQAKCGLLISYDSHSIYRVYWKKMQK